MNYPLLPYSQLVFDMLRTQPDVYTYRFTARIPQTEADSTRLKQAIDTALRNHPVFNMVVDEQGMQHYDAQVDPMHGQYCNVDVWEDEAYLYAKCAYNRILGDAISGTVLLEDVIRAYQGLPLAPDNYLTYLQQTEELKRSERYATDRLWLEQHFGTISCPVHPMTDVPLAGFEQATEGTLIEDYSDLREALVRLADEHLISLTAFFSLASALAIMEYNGTDESALTWAYEGRETEEEQRIFGSLHRDIPFRMSRISKADNSRTATRDELLRETRRAMREGVKHCSYPFTLTAPHNEVWDYALNVLMQPVPDATKVTPPFEYETLPADEQQERAYALLDVEIYNAAALTVVYRYSAMHYKEQSIRRFAQLVRKYAEWLTA